jgi:hypothetical protein
LEFFEPSTSHGHSGMILAGIHHHHHPKDWIPAQTVPE